MLAELLVLAGRAGQAAGLGRSMLWGSVVLLGITLMAPTRARASNNEAVLDAAGMAQLEQQATGAQPREQCFLFSELVHQLTEEAGREIADGKEEEAQATLKHADAVLTRMHTAVQGDAKKLKNAEMLMEHASRRLTDMLHVASEVSRSAVQATLQKLNALHTELLTQVFAK